MDYKCPMYPDLGGVADVMNPLFIDNAVALGPTRVMAAPQAGYAFVPKYGLDGVREALDVFTAAAFLFPE